MKGKVILFIFICFSILLKAQNTKDTVNVNCMVTAEEKKDPPVRSVKYLSVEGFVDAYYSFDLAQPANNQKPLFFYNHNRHNEFSLNLAVVHLNYNAEKTRASIGLMAGTYPQYNLAHEQSLMQHVFEAYGGVELSKDLWLDAGIFGSHLGFESAISSDNITLTRSMMAESSPYYLSGAKLTYSGVDKWTFQTVISNGWQNIKEPYGNDNKALGAQIVYEPNDKVLINYSNWWSDESLYKNPLFDPRGNRFFNDVYAIIQPSDKLKLVMALDFGMEENKLLNDWNVWYAPAVLVGYDWTNKVSTGLRGEYYVDEAGVIIQSDFAVLGTSLNLDYKPSKNAMLRVEGKWLKSQNAIFEQPDFSLSSDNIAITTSLAVRLGN